MDFILDDTYKVWLMEVNVSPDTRPTTSVTQDFVTVALPQYLALVLHLQQKEAALGGVQASTEDGRKSDHAHNSHVDDMDHSKLETTQLGGWRVFHQADLPLNQDACHLNPTTSDIDMDGKAELPVQVKDLLASTLEIDTVMAIMHHHHP